MAAFTCSKTVYGLTESVSTQIAMSVSPFDLSRSLLQKYRAASDLSEPSTHAAYLRRPVLCYDRRDRGSLTINIGLTALIEMY